MIEITYHKKTLILGVLLLLYALLCPLFLTEHTLRIYSTFRQALDEDKIHLLFLTSI